MYDPSFDKERKLFCVSCSQYVSNIIAFVDGWIKFNTYERDTRTVHMNRMKPNQRQEGNGDSYYRAFFFTLLWLLNSACKDKNKKKKEREKKY